MRVSIGIRSLCQDSELLGMDARGLIATERVILTIIVNLRVSGNEMPDVRR